MQRRVGTSFLLSDSGDNFKDKSEIICSINKLSEKGVLIMKYIVEYVELDKKTFEKFILNLSIKERAKIFETINYFLELKNNNLPIKESLSRHLEDGIFELRSHLIDKIARILYFYGKSAKIIITHCFIKKSQKTPRNEIEKAKYIRNQYKMRLKND